MLKTSWPKGAALPRSQKRRKRPASKAKRAERRTALDCSQLASRGEYAAKVFAWAAHESESEAIEAAAFAAAPSPTPKVHPVCIEPTYPRDVKGARKLLKLSAPSPMPYQWRTLPTKKF